MKQQKAFATHSGILLLILTAFALVLTAVPATHVSTQDNGRIEALDLLATGSNRREAREQKATETTTADKINNLTERYYWRCLPVSYPDMPPETIEEYCACTAVEMGQRLTEGELTTMAYGEGPPVKEEKLLMSVEAPCLYIPLGQEEYDACFYERRYQSIITNGDLREKACTCVKDGIRTYMKDYGSDFMAYYVEENGMPQERIAAIKKDMEYRKMLEDTRKNCLRAYSE